ncbi:exodeoxyribonuclease VII large subunit [Geobacter hydrogenophilus]|uniref:Exodeoxyribonuclease 7 large subunit n=1 Tax=Geobacter hydrogenophilus TaxID=40983 RepID=A0A9W6G238_9BACT|nr:exodeoxyribonuclease VII large subunit [Geobacter hydrogenophilus]MBT0893151.1 exodeoxyribonuclease VII large subunit [Geobacter hydrogenophilus]GLI39007.1 exodeoxyribonuclease 7 large subunit [Geobacter hydrogenophilus]
MELFPEKRILTVSQLTSLIRGVLEENFEHVWVEGEVSNLAMPASGHLYFTLKDAGAQIRCVMFRASARALKFRPRDGMGLIVRGRITVYEQRGDYQFLVEYLEPRGVGALQLAFIQLKGKLAKEGLFAEEHKRPIPSLPQRIGVVTSATGAAIHDILNVLNRRFANVEVLIRPVKVQGEGAADEIAQAITDFNRYGAVDVMIVGRGGGSLEDLWAFNEEKVARAIHRSRIPIITAVGHEIDFTIADFVADLRAPTPSAAAELVVKSKEELASKVEFLRHRLIQTMRRLLAETGGELEGLGRALRDPTVLLGHLSQRLDDLSIRLERAIVVTVKDHVRTLETLGNHLRLRNPSLGVERARERVIALGDKSEIALLRHLDRFREAAAVHSARLEALSPLGTLARGYSVALKLPERTTVKTFRQLAPNDRLELLFHQGRVWCRVDALEEDVP